MIRARALPLVQPARLTMSWITAARSGVRWLGPGRAAEVLVGLLVRQAAAGRGAVVVEHVPLDPDDPAVWSVGVDHLDAVSRVAHEPVAADVDVQQRPVVRVHPELDAVALVLLDHAVGQCHRDPAVEVDAVVGVVANTTLLKVPLESFPKSAPSPFAVSLLCEMSTRELPLTMVWSMYDGLPVVWYQEAKVSTLSCTHTPPVYVPGAIRIVSPLAAAATAAWIVGWSAGLITAAAWTGDASAPRPATRSLVTETSATVRRGGRSIFRR